MLRKINLCRSGRQTTGRCARWAELCRVIQRDVGVGDEEVSVRVTIRVRKLARKIYLWSRDLSNLQQQIRGKSSTCHLKLSSRHCNLQPSTARASIMFSHLTRSASLSLPLSLVFYGIIVSLKLSGGKTPCVKIKVCETGHKT